MLKASQWHMQSELEHVHPKIQNGEDFMYPKPQKGIERKLHFCFDIPLKQKGV